jgi:hypothetical protein
MLMQQCFGAFIPVLPYFRYILYLVYFIAAYLADNIVIIQGFFLFEAVDLEESHQGDDDVSEKLHFIFLFL